MHPKDILVDCHPVVQLINLHGEDLVGMEVGVFNGEGISTLVKFCENIKEMHGVDNWLPYVDYIGDPYGPQYTLTEYKAELNKCTAELNVKYLSGSPEKITLHHMDSNDCSEMFPDEYFDFIFVDTYLTIEQIINDLEVWYPKVKTGGLFIGHDWYTSQVKDCVLSFREKYNITNRMSTFNNCFTWRK